MSECGSLLASRFMLAAEQPRFDWIGDAGWESPLQHSGNQAVPYRKSCI
jgi:hypothetical protein